MKAGPPGDTRASRLIGMTAAFLTSVAAAFCLGGCGQAADAPASPARLQIVAAENFWGSLASQLGGDQAQVLSVVSDPNADPHEYTSSAATARAFADADYVIINGAGYDNWSANLLSAGANPHRKVLNVADLLGKKIGDNPHFWYDPSYVDQVAKQINLDLAALDPRHADYYRRQYESLRTSLAGYENRIRAIRKQFGGTKVAATEDIFVYLAKAAGLDLISPPAFMQAVAEGNDPPVQSVIEFQDQLKSKTPAVLVYNQQTITPLTQSIKTTAKAEAIPVVGITETVSPPDARFQDWMDAEIKSLQSALSVGTVKK